MDEAKLMGIQHSQQDAWNAIAKIWKGYRQKPFRDIQTFIDIILASKPGRILEIGCGSARNLVNFARNGFQCFGIDFSEEMLNYARQFAKDNKIKLGLKYGWAQNIPFPRNSFDYVLNIAVIHHLKKEDRFHSLKEMLRIMKPGGIAIVTAWNKFNPKFWKFLLKKETFIPWKINDIVYHRYYYFFSFFELKNLIKKAGFKIIKSSSPFARNISFIVRK